MQETADRERSSVCFGCLTRGCRFAAVKYALGNRVLAADICLERLSVLLFSLLCLKALRRS